MKNVGKVAVDDDDEHKNRTTDFWSMVLDYTGLARFWLPYNLNCVFYSDVCELWPHEIYLRILES